MEADPFGSIASILCVGGFILAFGGFGVFLLVRLVRNFLRARESQHWQNATGRVLFSGVDTHLERDDDGSTSTTYRAKVVYAYEIGGETYERDQIAFNSNMHSSNYKQQAALAAQYPQGEEVTVYYNPDDPGEAVLERKVRSVFSMLMMAAVFLAIAIIVIYSVMRSNVPMLIQNLFNG